MLFRSEKKTGVILLAAGKGTRMHSRVQKQYMLLNGRPLLYYAAAAFEQSPVQDIILVTGEQEIDVCRRGITEKYGFNKIKRIIPGGAERYHSVYEGLKELQRLGYGKGDCVLIHDGARPLVDGEIIRRVMEDAYRYHACAAGMPSKDTIKQADRNGFAENTPDRRFLWNIQTPQGFSFPLIMEAYEKMMSCEEYQQGVTDDAMVAERMAGCRVKLTEGAYQNMKVTTPEDITVAEALLHSRLS